MALLQHHHQLSYQFAVHFLGVIADVVGRVEHEIGRACELHFLLVSADVELVAGRVMAGVLPILAAGQAARLVAGLSTVRVGLPVASAPRLHPVQTIRALLCVALSINATAVGAAIPCNWSIFSRFTLNHTILDLVQLLEGRDSISLGKDGIVAVHVSRVDVTLEANNWN